MLLAMEQDNIQTSCLWRLRHEPCLVCDTVCYCHGAALRKTMTTPSPINWCCTAAFVHGGNQVSSKQNNARYRNQPSFDFCQQNTVVDVTSLTYSESEPTQDSLLYYHHGYRPCYCIPKEPKSKSPSMTSVLAQESLLTTYQAYYGKPKPINEVKKVILQFFMI